MADMTDGANSGHHGNDIKCLRSAAGAGGVTQDTNHHDRQKPELEATVKRQDFVKCIASSMRFRDTLNYFMAPFHLGLYLLYVLT